MGDELILAAIIIASISTLAAMFTAISAYKVVKATKDAAELPILKDFLCGE